ncbi:hypothetical protein Ga0466249_001903 [Sporomusaceae bacterium BoRhaA]|uniref:S-layer homology domain-containing protein n=1 Tax=Pelorhabdus rhamnosifermentans TaxID=2772457 RepID=UPI001C06446F|nr:S-layer homology domain-containing protein [Pelorhabdus rhamnosifermentans]MBU2700798.1 hypothetical protein [Pelorhabdus rhamnosifermentans]
MKKNLIVTFALMFILSVVSTAFAAVNPFDDVPAGNWAYDSVTKLAQAGIIDGYSDGTFHGDKTVTRYEMAQIVAKAISKTAKMKTVDASTKAEVDKLSKEFADELQSLGVRVTKIEAKQSNVKLSADLRVRWNNFSGKANADQWKDRYRLNMTADINDTTSLYARFVFQDDKFNQDSAQRLSDMALTTKGLIDKTNVTVGRYSLNMGPTGYLSGTTGDLDGIMTNTNIGNFGLMLGYAQVRQTNGNTLVTNSLWIKNIDFAEMTYNMGKAKIYGDYFKNLNAGQSDGNGNTVLDAYNIVGGGVTYKFDSVWKLIGEHYVNRAQAVKMSDGSSPTATIVQLDYKGADASKPGSWGALIEYNKFEGNSLPYQFSGPYTRFNPNDFGINPSTGGVKSYAAEIDYTLAKNITFNGIYQFDAENTTTGQAAPYPKWIRAQINYYF